MHSSGMRTARFLTVSQHALCRGNVSQHALGRGVSAQGEGVLAQGGCLPWGCLPMGGVFCLGGLPGRGCPPGGCLVEQPLGGGPVFGMIFMEHVTKW